MELINHTPFPALAFAGVDTRGHGFHVVVLRQTLTWGAGGMLVYADEQAPLCEADEAHADFPGEYRQESDLCHYKPRCDLICNAVAHAPALGQREFSARLRLLRPAEAEIPLPPVGLNPLQSPDAEALRLWRAQGEIARRDGRVLIDKTLLVSGARHFERSASPTAWLSRLRGGPAWRLSSPTLIDRLPVRLRFAYGGQCRIDADDPCARRVERGALLTEAQRAAHPDALRGGTAPVAHSVFGPNPQGLGWIAAWWLAATEVSRLHAPQIEVPRYRIGELEFDQGAAGGLDTDRSAAGVGGLGVRPKGHPHRATLTGTIDQDFIASDAALPPDFDFAVWNAAWPDQQSEFLHGDEHIELTNLCAADTPGAQRTEHGILLRLALPGDLPFVVVRFETGAIGELRLQLDTLIVEPETRQVSCVWRATCATEPQVRLFEARQLAAARRSAMIGAEARVG